jgi:hypothetical protein
MSMCNHVRYNNIFVLHGNLYNYNVDAFTTKSLFIGHTDYKYLRW